MSTPSAFDRFKRWLRGSVMLRILGIAILILLLMIPTGEIRSLIYERESLRLSAESEIASTWGGDQTLTGPVLTVPYVETYKDADDNVRTRTEYAHFLPDSIGVKVSLSPEHRHRGIYDAVVYQGDFSVAGAFSFPDIAELNLPEGDMRWDEAFVSVGISDVRGIENQVMFEMTDQALSFSPGMKDPNLMTSGISAALLLDPAARKEIPFRFDLQLRGSNRLYFSPLGKITRVSMEAGWADPKFAGSFLPEHQIGNEGFSANWEVLHLNRSFPQSWTGSGRPEFASAYNFGVELLIPVDHYRKTTRSVKYGLMLISLTFLIFFFVEIMYRQRIHPISYLLVGLALVIFYALLLSLSEHIAFGWAFLVGAVAVIALITVYSKSVLKSQRLTSVLAGLLVLMFGFNFALLQLQDYALLIGTLGLFAVLAAVMLVSRRIDWYGYAKATEEESGDDE